MKTHKQIILSNILSVKAIDDIVDPYKDIAQMPVQWQSLWLIFIRHQKNDLKWETRNGLIYGA